MLYKKLWGEEMQVPPTGFREARITKANNLPHNCVYAEIVALRESVRGVRHVVTDENGAAIRSASIEVAYTGPGFPSDPDAREIGPNLSPYTRAKTFMLSDIENGIAFYDGSKIGPDGPADYFLVVGKYGTLDIYSDVLATGLYSSDVAASAQFMLRYIP